MADIDINEALAIVRQMKGHFRAFERAEQFLLFLANAESAASEAQRRKNGLLKEIEALEVKRADLKARYDADLDKAAKDLRAVQDELKTARTKATEEIHELQRVHAERMQAFEDEMRRRVDSAQQTLGALNGRIAAAQKKLDEIEQTRADLLKRLGAS